MKKIFLIAAAAIALAACDNIEDNPAPSPVAVKISATIRESILSRADDNSWKWNEGAKIGISSTVGDVADPYINLEYTTKDGDGKFTGTDIFFYKPMTLTAYFPFTGKEGTAPGKDGVISATTDTEDQKDQLMIDFLWDSKKGIGVDKDQNDFSVSDPNVKFIFSHRMSKLTFTFQSSEPVYDPDNPDKMVSRGVDVRNMISYEIEGLGIKGTFNTATGECAIDGTRDGLTMEYEKETTHLEGEEIYNYKREFPSLIVFPQTKPDEKNFILHITTDELSEEGRPEQKYKCMLGFADDEIKPGCHYKFTIKVTRRGLIVGNLTIEPWETEKDKDLIATIDGEKVFKEPEEGSEDNDNQE